MTAADAPDPLDDAVLDGPSAAVLGNPVAHGLLHAPIPARLAYLGRDGAPRVVPVWSHWTGQALVIGTFPDSGKARALRDGHRVAVSIDTERYPYQALQLRGRVRVEHLPGLVPEYVLAAHRYLGRAEADRFLARLAGRAMIRFTVHVDHARLLDMRSRTTTP